jgi:hypothetical protein
MNQRPNSDNKMNEHKSCHINKKDVNAESNSNKKDMILGPK